MSTLTLANRVLQEDAPWLIPWSVTQRPWVQLYGLRVRVKKQDVELALIQRLLPEDVMLNIFLYIPPYQLGKVGCVCSSWAEYVRQPTIWTNHCKRAFQADSPATLEQHLKNYKYDWREMFLKRPHLRFEGLYVSRNTYIHTGITEWRIKNPVHLVTYFRYIRFFPNGTLLQRTSPEVVSKVEKTMRKIPDVVKPDDTVYAGRWHLQNERLRLKMTLPNTAGTEIRTVLKLRSTSPGANNRLDVEKILSFEQSGGSVDIGEFQSEEQMEVQGALSHSRGMSTFVFIPDEEIHTHILNTDPDKLDFFLPG